MRLLSVFFVEGADVKSKISCMIAKSNQAGRIRLGIRAWHKLDTPVGSVANFMIMCCMSIIICAMTH